MSRVDRSELEGGLQSLQQKGVIGDWIARPLGMYSISVLGKEILRPDTKETAMWTMGALHGHAMAEVITKTGAELDIGNKRQVLAEYLDKLQGFAVIGSWSLDEDGDYTLCLPDGRTSTVYAKDMEHWISGATEAVVALSQNNISVNARKTLDENMRALRGVGIITSWISQDDGAYEFSVAGDPEPLESTAANTLIWATAAMTTAHWFIGKIDDGTFRNGMNDGA